MSPDKDGTGSRRARHGPTACVIEWSTRMARPIVRYATTADGLEIAYQVLGAGPLDVVIVPGHHPFASLLIAKGLDVVFVSRQLGHASPATTLGVYAHLFDQVQHAATARAALEESRR